MEAVYWGVVTGAVYYVVKKEEVSILFCSSKLRCEQEITDKRKTADLKTL